MVRLNRLLTLCLLYALEDVGIYSSLREEFNAFELSCLISEYVNELCADDLSLLLGIGYACKKIEETIGSVDVDKISLECVTEHLDNRLALALSHKAVVNVNTDKLLADSLDKKCRNYRRVNSAGECEKHLTLADLLAHEGNLLLDESVSQLPCGNTCHSIGSLVGIHILAPPLGL